MSNSFLKVYLESDFQYMTGKYESGIDQKTLDEYLQRELLQYQLYFQQGKWLDSEIQHIADELEKTGKLFAKNQGFSEGLSVGSRNSGRLRILGTGELVRSIHARPETTKDGWKTIIFYNDAKNMRGEYYAGHMEYGFHDRGGNFIPARPFMRPALYAVAEGSKGNFRNIMQGLLGNLWTGKGFQGVSELTFGTKIMSPQSNFWSNSKSFTGQLSKKTNLGQLKGNRHRKQMSKMRRSSKYSVSKKSGYKLTANRRDFQKLQSQSGKKMHRTDLKNAKKSRGKKTSGIQTTEKRRDHLNNPSYLTKAKAQGKYSRSERYKNKPQKSNINQNIRKEIGSQYNYDMLIHEYVNAGFTWEQAAERVKQRYG